MKIAYLGPENTYTEKVAKEMFPESDLIPLKPILKVVKAVENKEVDFGVVPLENFYEGEVRETLDALTESTKTRIVKDRAIEIIHCLGVLPNQKNNVPPHLKVFCCGKKSPAGECGLIGTCFLDAPKLKAVTLRPHSKDFKLLNLNGLENSNFLRMRF